MIIEILDVNDDVITNIIKSSDVDADVAFYGGVSWRPYVMPDEARIETLREDKIAQTKAEGLRRVTEVIPALTTLEMIELMVELWPMLDDTAASADMVLAKDIYVYARSKVFDAQTATEVQLNAYDPITDPGWPI